MLSGNRFEPEDSLPMTHESSFPIAPGESETQLGSRSDDEGVDDHLLNWMQKNGVPLTRENYLELNYPDGVPDELDEDEQRELDQIFGSAEE